MGYSGDGAIPLLSGSAPGLLDISQPSRLLRTATCNLFFAAFDPHAARVDIFPNVSGLHIDPGGFSKRVNPETAASTNGKRVVIETDPENGTCTWRFVPRAKADGDGRLGDEGPWPRVVALCGRPVRMTQDQWDIHKLDPAYDCVVHSPPNLTTITPISVTSTAQPHQTPSRDIPVTPTMTPGSLDDNTPTPKAKYGVSPTSQNSDSPLKRQKTSFVDLDPMAIDEDPFFIPNNEAPANDVSDSKKRRRFSEQLGSISASDPGLSIPKPSGTRSGNGDAHESRDADVSPPHVKRSRTRSPYAVRREMEQKRMDREKRRKADMNARLKARWDALHEAFWKDIGVFPLDTEIPPPQWDYTDSYPTGIDEEAEHDEEVERLAKIEESRRKLAELDKDRPLWEESARKRQQKEAEEELLRKREKMKQEEERLQEHMRTPQKQREEQSEQERKRTRDARIRELSSRMFVAQPRNTFRWNSMLALERYMQAAADFDSTKFTAPANPMSFARVPWPVLHASFSVQDVDWDTVEAFFGEVQRFFTPVEFKELVEKSHRRFHPDRWRSRGLLVSVQNETERDILEVAGSTVAQALTPLWKEVTGRI